MKFLSILLVAALLPFTAIAETVPAVDLPHIPATGPSPQARWTDVPPTSRGTCAATDFQGLSTCEPLEQILRYEAGGSAMDGLRAFKGVTPLSPQDPAPVAPASTTAMVLAGLAFVVFSIRKSRTE
jgi:hypothetical protein